MPPTSCHVLRPLLPQAATTVAATARCVVGHVPLLPFYTPHYNIISGPVIISFCG